MTATMPRNDRITVMFVAFEGDPIIMRPLPREIRVFEGALVSEDTRSRASHRAV